MRKSCLIGELRTDSSLYKDDYIFRISGFLVPFWYSRETSIVFDHENLVRRESREREERPIGYGASEKLKIDIIEGSVMRWLGSDSLEERLDERKVHRDRKELNLSSVRFSELLYLHAKTESNAKGGSSYFLLRKEYEEKLDLSALRADVTASSLAKYNISGMHHKF